MAPRSWTDTTYQLAADTDLVVCPHADSVSLAVPGYTNEGDGFRIDFSIAHLPRLRELVAALEQSQAPSGASCLFSGSDQRHNASAALRCWEHLPLSTIHSNGSGWYAVTAEGDNAYDDWCQSSPEELEILLLCEEV